MKRNILMEFTDEEIDKILDYQKHCGAETVQEAILNAIAAVMGQDKLIKEAYDNGFADGEMRQLDIDAGLSTTMTSGKPGR